MSLTVPLTRTFLRSRARLVPAGTSTASKLARALADLEHEPVPADTDEPDMLPPVLPCFARRVPGTALALMFRRISDDVFVVGVRIWP